MGYEKMKDKIIETAVKAKLLEARTQIDEIFSDIIRKVETCKDDNEIPKYMKELSERVSKIK